MWEQSYDPFQSAWLSTLVAALPVLTLLTLLMLGMRAHRAAMLGLIVAIAVAKWGFGMPAKMAFASAVYGAAFGLLPIGWIVLNAVFLYQLTVRSGQFDILKRSVASLSPDRRIQALLIAFCFGSFIEGAAGFGTPVAISAALLIGLGFSPLHAASLALIANTSPVAFGALGTPITTLAKVSGIDEMLLSQMAGRQLPFFSLLIPAWLVWILSGWKGVRGCWPAILVCGGTFALLQFLLSNFHGPTLVDVVAGVGAMISLSLFLQFWQPKEIWKFRYEASGTDVSLPSLTRKQVVSAWIPWVVLSAFVFVWGWPAVKTALNGGSDKRPNILVGFSKWSVEVPYLHHQVFPIAPVAEVIEGETRASKPLAAIYEANWLSTTGTAIFLASVVSAWWMGISWIVFWQQAWETLIGMRLALLTIACMLALAWTTKYGGSDATMGLAMTHTGWFYPLFAPILGWLGVALTGSDTSSNALFGNLQRITAQSLDLNPILIVASNSTGGVMGKMIDAQSIVVAAVATQQSGEEGKILRFVFAHQPYTSRDGGTFDSPSRHTQCPG